MSGGQSMDPGTEDEKIAGCEVAEPTGLSAENFDSTRPSLQNAEKVTGDGSRPSVSRIHEDGTIPSLARIDHSAELGLVKKGELAPGDVIDGRYEVVSLLGKGGMSTVYLVRHLTLHSLQALKLMHPHMNQDETSIKRFKQEAEAVSKLSHPHVMSVSDFGGAGGQPYMVMEYLDGRALSDELKSGGVMDPFRAARIFIQACDALEHAHAHGLVHRDLKPSNIMLIERDGDKDFVKVVDFGIAKMLPQDGADKHQLTQTGEIFGSPSYMSPEQCEGKVVDARSDIYSMGCLMYEILTGQVPFTGDSVLDVLRKQIEETPEGFAAVYKDRRVRVPLELIVFGAMAKAPERRYQSMSRLKQDLELFVRGQKQGLVPAVMSVWHLWQLKRGPRSRYVPMRVVVASVVSVILLSIVTAAAWPFLVFNEPRNFYADHLWKAVELDNQEPNYEAANVRNDPSFHVGERMFKELTKSFGGQTKEEESAFYLRRAEKYYRLRNFGDAQHDWERVNQINNWTMDDVVGVGDLLIPVKLANCYYWQGEIDKALPIYEKALVVLRKSDPEESSGRLLEPVQKVTDIFVRKKYMDDPVKAKALLERLEVMEKVLHSNDTGSAAIASYGQTLNREAELLRRAAHSTNDRKEKIRLLSQSAAKFEEARVPSEKAIRMTDVIMPYLGGALANEDLYLLGVSPQASRKKAKDSYATAMQKLHDAYNSGKEEATVTEYAIAVANHADFLWRLGFYFDALGERLEAVSRQ